MYFVVKRILCNILSVELVKSKFQINIKFENSHSNHIFSVLFKTEENIILSVNLNAIMKALGQKMISRTINIYYCGFFISNYIKMLEDAAKVFPTTYLEGLIVLNACVDKCCNKKTMVFSPLTRKNMFSKKFDIRAINVKSAILSLTQIKVKFSKNLHKGDAQVIENHINDMLLFLSLPEASYNKKHIPIHELFSQVEKLTSHINKDPELLNDYEFLKIFDEVKLKNNSTSDFIKILINTKNPFYCGMALRMVSFLPCKLTEDEYNILCDVANEYRKACVTFFIEANEINVKLIDDNKLVIRKVIKEINKFLGKYCKSCNSGTIHCLC